LLNFFLGRLDNGNIKLDDGALEYLLAYDWPGNIRELKNLAERIVVMYNGDTVSRETMETLIQKRSEPHKENAPPPGDGQHSVIGDILALNYNEAKVMFEKHYLEYQLERHDGIISRTAEAIGIYPSNLHAKLRKYDIRTER
jgi:two-component system nitrogen regulation response regulator NtrX